MSYSSASSGALLLTVFQSHTNYQLEYAYSQNGTTWSSPGNLLAGAEGSNPVAANFNGRIYVAYQSWTGRPGTQLNIAWSQDGTSWQLNPEPIATDISAFHCAMFVLSDTLYIIYQQTGSGQLCMTASRNGTSWSQPAPIGSETAMTGTAATVFDDRVYLVFQSSGTQQLMLTTSADASNWTAPASLIGAVPACNPTIAAFGGQLFVAYQPWQDKVVGELYLACYGNGNNWSHGSAPIARNIGGWPPVIAAFDDALIISYQEINSALLCSISSTNGTSWTEPVYESNFATETGPALCDVGGDPGQAVISPPSVSTALVLPQQAYVSFGQPGGLAGATAMTLEVWINVAQPGATAPVLIASGANATFLIQLANGIPSATITTAAGSSVATADAAIELNQWTNLTLTYDPAGLLLVLYVNGLEVDAAENAVANPGSPAYTLLLGAASPACGGATLQAAVGRVLAWSVARTDSDVLADSLSTGVLDPVAEPNLELFVDFSLLPVVDQSGTGCAVEYEGALLSIVTPALQLDGMSWADLGYGAQLDVTGGSFTIDGWFNAVPYRSASGAADGTGTLVSRSAPGTVEYLVTFCQAGTGSGYLSFTACGATIRSADLPCNVWLHFAAAYDATDSAIYLYVNGNLQASLLVAQPVAAASASTLLGATGDGTMLLNFFEGMIQNTRFWNIVLTQAQIRNWMFSQPITDSTLLGAFDFSVDPPVDTTGLSSIALQGNALAAGQTILLSPSAQAATIGVINALSDTYQGQTDEQPVPAPTNSAASAIPSMQQPLDLLSDANRQRSWDDLVARLPPGIPARRLARLRKKLDASFAEAERLFRKNPQLKQPVSKTVVNGIVRLTYHMPHGDVLLYEGDAALVTDCQLWWLGFTGTVVIGLVQIVFQLYTGQAVSTAVSTRVYNLMARNPAVEASLWDLLMLCLSDTASTTALTVSAFSVLGATYKAGLLWSLLKLILKQAGWWALAKAVTKLVLWLSPASAAAEAETVASVVTWVAQVSYQTTSYTSSCPAS